MKCLYYYNNQSGKNKLEKKKDYIVQALQTKYSQVDCFESKDLEDLKHKLKTDNYDAIVFAGGDGTVNNILNWTKDLKNTPTFGYIPSGTVNDFAKNLNLNKNIKKSLNVILNGNSKEFDCFEQNGRVGIYVCCTGIFTTASYDVKQKEKKRFGKLAYYFRSIKEVFNTKAYQIDVEQNGEKKTLNSVLTLLINSQSVAGYRFNRKADLCDGEMEFVSINQKKSKLTFASFLRICKLFLFGLNGVKKSKAITYFKFKQLKIGFKEKKTINIDGENGGEGNINICVLPKKVKFFC